MKFRHAITGATVLSAAAAGAAGPALAHQERNHSVPQGLAHHYETLYDKVHKLGANPGRDIVKDGIRKHGHGRRATANDVRRSIRALERMEAQLTGSSTGAASTATASTTTATTSTTSSTSGGSTSLPSCTWQPESGGDYNAVNSSSGARGKYQIMPSTYAAYGGDGSWSPADQDRVAAKIYAAQGGSAWVNC